MDDVGPCWVYFIAVTSQKDVKASSQARSKTSDVDAATILVWGSRRPDRSTTPTHARSTGQLLPVRSACFLLLIPIDIRRRPVHRHRSSSCFQFTNAHKYFARFVFGVATRGRERPTCLPGTLTVVPPDLQQPSSTTTTRRR